MGVGMGWEVGEGGNGSRDAVVPVTPAGLTADKMKHCLSQQLLSPCSAVRFGSGQTCTLQWFESALPVTFSLLTLSSAAVRPCHCDLAPFQQPGFVCVCVCVCVCVYVSKLNCMLINLW